MHCEHCYTPVVAHIQAQHCAALDLLRMRALHRMLRASMD